MEAQLMKSEEFFDKVVSELEKLDDFKLLYSLVRSKLTEEQLRVTLADLIEKSYDAYLEAEFIRRFSGHELDSDSPIQPESIAKLITDTGLKAFLKTLPEGKVQ